MIALALLLNPCSGLVDRGYPCSFPLTTDFIASDAYQYHITGDTNWDGRVDIEDFLSILNNWGPVDTGQEAPCIDGDLCQDDHVDVCDFLLVLTNWGLESNRDDWIIQERCW